MIVLCFVQWLRDSAVQAAIYFPRVQQHPALHGLLEGVIRTHAYFVLQVLRASFASPCRTRRCCE